MPTIRFLTSSCAVDFPEGDDVNLLRVAIRNECDVPFRCASGNCGTDRVYVVDGHDALSEPRRRERDRLGDLLDAGWRLACQTYVSGDCSITWDPEQKPLDERMVDRSLPAANERLQKRWLSEADSAGAGRTDGEQQAVDS